MLNNNINVTLCITGGIASYKVPNLASKLKQNGFNVNVIMSENSTKFITPLTFKSITKNNVITDMFKETDYIPHISISELTDIFVIAPATANIIAKIANGIADDMISTVMLSTKAPTLIVPAMNINMYENKITQRNIKLLKDYGFYFIEPEDGYLACGVKGKGRFPDIETIYGYIIKILAEKKSNSILKNKNILITAGGTIEDIDPVRFISNRSSGKTAFSFAEEFISRGANVKIVSGNVNEKLLYDFSKRFNFVEIIKIRSCNDMKNIVENEFSKSDILFMCAAVSDFKVKYHNEKIKKRENLVLNLEQNDDILSCIAKNKSEKQIIVGFAAETNDLENYAIGKLKNKNLDFIIANSVTGQKSAMGTDFSELYIFNRFDSEKKVFEYNEKSLNSIFVVDYLENLIKKNIPAFC